MVHNIPSKTLDGGCHQKNGETISCQMIHTVIAYIPFFTSFYQMASLKNHDQETLLLDYEIPWSKTVFLISGVISAPLLCKIADMKGRRFAVILTSLLQTISFLPFLYEINVYTIMVSNIIFAISLSGIYTVNPIYVREVSCNRIRGFLVLFFTVMAAGGSLCFRGLEHYNGYTMLCGVIVILILQCILMMTLKEPSVWEKKIEDIKISIVSPSNGVEISSNNRPEKLTNTKNYINNYQETRTLMKMLSHYETRMCLKIGILTHTVYVLGGRIVFLDYTRALAESGVNIDHGLWKLAVPGLVLAGSLFAVVFVDLWERKYLLTLSLWVYTVFLGIMAVYMQADMIATSTPWAPITCLMVLVFGYGVGWGLPHLIMTEVLNFQSRCKIIGILYCYTQILEIIQLHCFSYIEELMGMYTLFYVFAGINIYGAVYTWFGVPYLKNRSYRQIEKQMRFVPLL